MAARLAWWTQAPALAGERASGGRSDAAPGGSRVHNAQAGNAWQSHAVQKVWQEMAQGHDAGMTAPMSREAEGRRGGRACSVEGWFKACQKCSMHRSRCDGHPRPIAPAGYWSIVSGKAGANDQPPGNVRREECGFRDVGQSTAGTGDNCRQTHLGYPSRQDDATRTCRHTGGSQPDLRSGLRCG